MWDRVRFATVASVIGACALLVQCSGDSSHEKSARPGLASFYDESFTLAERRYVNENTEARRIGNSVAVRHRRHWQASPVINRDSIVGDIVSIRPDYNRDRISDPNLPSAEETYIFHGTTSPGAGPEYLLCIEQNANDMPCALVTAVKDSAGRFRLDIRLGSPKFRRPGVPMELFIASTLTERQPSIRLVGGVHGRDPDEVRITLMGGTHVTADLSNAVAPGDSVWTATLSRPVVSVVTVDKHGAAIEKREVLPCKGGIACEVR